MNKKILSSILFGIILFSGVCVNAYENGIKKEAGYISLNASKTKEIEPNIARVTFAVENTAETAQKATLENNEVSTKIISALKKETNSETEVIKTNNFSVRPVYTTTASGKRTIKNYSAVNSVIVETKDTKKIAKLIDTAIANGANRTEGLYYSYENDESMCNSLYPELLKELKAQADTIAKSAGSSVEGIKHINASCSTDMAVSNGRFYANAMVSDGAVETAEISTPVEAGKVKIRVYVSADFYLK